VHTKSVLAGAVQAMQSIANRPSYFLNKNSNLGVILSEAKVFQNTKGSRFWE
jgi:hypothetical protein